MAELHELAMNAVYAQTLSELAEKNRNLVVLEADLARATGTHGTFSRAYPDQFVEVGVAEANMIGVAAGLAVEGKIPFCASFTPFATRRVYDQVTISVAYANTNVKIIGTSPGVTATMNGGTHMCFQDLAIMRAMPNMMVFSPCDAYELRSCVRWMAAHSGPMYMQLIREEQPAVFDETYEFDPNQAVRLTEGADVTVVSTGYMTPFALQAAHELAEEGVGVDLLHYPSVKPFDADTLVASARKTGHVVTIETQNILGGLGGAVCEILSERLPTPVKRLGVHDQFGEVATVEYLFEKHGFGVEHLKQACREAGAPACG